MLFRLAIAHINPENDTRLSQKLQQAPAINGNRLGDTMFVSNDQDNNSSDLWIDGERYQIFIDKGSRYITQDDGTLISAWQTDSEIVQVNNELGIGDSADRPFKTLGIPDRRLNLTSGEYLAYDDYGLAVRISNNQVRGWFLYGTH